MLSILNEIKREDFDVYIKEEQKLDETDGSTNNIYSLINDLMPRRKRPRPYDTDNITPSKRMKRTEEVPNFRRPWPTTVKSPMNFPTTHKESNTSTYTNFSISNIINEDNSSLQETEKDKNVPPIISNFHDMPLIYDHDRNLDIKKNIEFNWIDNIAKKISDDFQIIKDKKRRTKIVNASEVWNDLILTSDSDDYESGYVSEIYGHSENNIKNDANKDIKQEIKAQPEQNDSNSIWTIQNNNTEKLKLVISKENNNNTSHYIKSQMGVNYISMDWEEQPLMIPNKLTPLDYNCMLIEEQPLMLPHELTPFDYNCMPIEEQPLMLPHELTPFDYNCMPIEEQPLMLPNELTPFEYKSDRKVSNSENKAKKQTTRKLSNSKNKTKNKSNIEIEPLTINTSDNLQNTNTEKLKLVISKENNNSSHKKPHMEGNYNYMTIEELPFYLPDDITPNDYNCMTIEEQSSLIPNELKTFEKKSNRKVSNSKNKTKKHPTRKESNSKNKIKKQTKKRSNIEIEPSAINTSDNLQKMYAEKVKLFISEENDKYFKKFPKELNYNCMDIDKQPLISPNKQTTFENKSNRKISNSKNKTKCIEIEPSIRNTPDNHGNSLKDMTPLPDFKIEPPAINTPDNHGNSLNDTTPLPDINKKTSKSLRRHSLRDISDMNSNIIKLENNQINEKVAQHSSRFYMNTLTWKIVKQVETIVSDGHIKVQKMILHQNDKTTEVAVKLHLENLDWLDLDVPPKSMVLEEGAVLASLQGIRGVPFLFGVITENPPALVMSYYKGKTIGEYLEEENTLMALKIFVRTCELVGKINHRGLAHYDIHADNILGRVNNKNHISVTLLNYGFCRTIHVNPYYGIYTDPEELEGHHLPIDIINKKCNGRDVDRFSLCFLLYEIIFKMKDTPETNEIYEVLEKALNKDLPHQRPSATHLAQLVTKLVGKHTSDSWSYFEIYAIDI